MLTYKAMYKYVEGGVHAEVLDFPGVISFGATLEDARRMLASAWAGTPSTPTRPRRAAGTSSGTSRSSP